MGTLKAVELLIPQESLTPRTSQPAKTMTAKFTEEHFCICPAHLSRVLVALCISLNKLLRKGLHPLPEWNENRLHMPALLHFSHLLTFFEP